MTATNNNQEAEQLKSLTILTFNTLQRLVSQYQRQLGNMPQPRRALDFALHAVRGHPEATASELALAMGETDSRHIGRRLSDLARRGLVTKGPARRCNVTGRKAAVWSVAAVRNTAPDTNMSSGSSMPGQGGLISIQGGVGGSVPPTITPPNNPWATPLGITGMTMAYIPTGTQTGRFSVASPNPAATPQSNKPTPEAVIDKMTRGEILSSEEYQILKDYYRNLKV